MAQTPKLYLKLITGFVALVGSLVATSLVSPLAHAMPPGVPTTGEWLNAYVIKYDGRNFVDQNPNDNQYYYVNSDDGCRSELHFTKSLAGANRGTSAQVKYLRPSPNGGCDTLVDFGNSNLVQLSNRERRDVYFYKDGDNNIKHVNQAGVIFANISKTVADTSSYPPHNIQLTYWENPTGNGTDAGGNICFDIITSNNLLMVVRPTDKSTLQGPDAQRYTQYYNALHITPPSSGNVCALSPLNGKGDATKYEVFSTSPVGNYTAYQLHVGGTASATGPNVGKAPAPESSAGEGNSDDDSQDTCRIDGIGWIICPVVNFMGTIVDASYHILDNTLLKVPPVNTNINAKDNGLYQAWSIMRTFANVAFVIAFMIIIYSQITGMGVTNYGIKKLLPRLIIAAILVNVSYWVCAIAVDVSNILGNSLKGLMDTIAGQITMPNTGFWSNGWQGLGSEVLAGTIAIGSSVALSVALGLTVLLPILISALLAVVTVIVVLTMRQVFIILLIVIAPLAFVALLLPNTEKWFKRWREFLTAMLLVYPIIALIFGASALASRIIMASSDNFFVQVVGAGAALIPLAITPVVMKSAGGILGKIGAVVNNPNKGPFDRMRKGASRLREDQRARMKGRDLERGGKILSGNGRALGKENSRRRRVAAFLTSRGSTYAVNRDQKSKFSKAVAEESAQEYFANRALTQEGFAEHIAGNAKMAESLKASSQSTVDKQDTESVNSRVTLMRSQTDPRKMISVAGEALTNAIKNKDKIGARAAQQILLNSGNKGLIELNQQLSAVEQSGHLSGDGAEVSAALRKDLNGAGLKPKNNVLASWSYMDKSLQDILKDPKTFTSLSDRELVGQSEGNLAAAVKSKAISVDRAKQLLASENLGAEFNPAKRAIIQKVVDDSQTAPGQPVTTQVSQSHTPDQLDIPHETQPQTPSQPQTQQPSQPPVQQNPNTTRTSQPSGTSNWRQQPNGLYTPPTNPDTQPPNPPDDSNP